LLEISVIKRNRFLHCKRMWQTDRSRCWEVCSRRRSHLRCKKRFCLLLHAFQ